MASFGKQTITGMRDLEKALAALGTEMGGKILKSAANKAVKRTMDTMIGMAPMGKRSHRTYKGRLVAPGFLKQSVKKKTYYRKGRVTVNIGVTKEAFYGVSFTDYKRKGQRRQPWFVETFIRGRDSMQSTLASELKKKIAAVVKRQARGRRK